MNYYLRLFLLLVGLVFPIYLSASASAVPASSAPSHIQVELIQEEKTIQPSRPFWVAVRLNIENGWHVYWKNPGDAGIPLKIEWELPKGFRAEEHKWPFPEKFNLENMVGFGYHDEVILLTEIIPPSTLQSGDKMILSGNVKWLVCSSETCQPGSAPIQVSLQVDSSQTPFLDQAYIDLFEKARSKLPKSKVKVKTIRKEGIVQLQVPNVESAKDHVTSIDFFPEQKDVIDHSVEPMVALNQSQSSTKNNYLVNLKGSDEIGAATKTLKGVLVIHTKNDKDVQAFDIESTIQEQGEDNLLSFIDLEEGSTDFIPASAIGNSEISPSVKPIFEGGLSLAIVFAFLGGMILNLMPCVLPVMSFKVMSFVKMAGQSRSLTIKHGLIFSLGVLMSFWILATTMLLLRTYGQAVGWGFQLQEPLFVVILASILFIFALSLFGVFELGLFVASWAGQTAVEKSQKSSGYTASFFSGVMATAVATPCTGPFLGSAVGFAVTLPMFQSLLIFTSLGLGMSFPYLLLAAFPSCLRFIPKPGYWMEIFKGLMGFLLLATVLWLMWVFSAQTNPLSLICLLGGLLCFAMGAWVYGQGSSPLTKKSKRLMAYAVVFTMAIAGCQVILYPRESWYNDESPLVQKQHDNWAGWETFSPERVAELQAQGIPVLIDFTAKWCLICQANHLVFSSENVSQKLDEAGVVKLKADWTKNDPVITQELSKFGRTSVPLYVLYGKNPGQEPVILPQVLTSDVVVQHLETALSSEEIASK